MLDLAYPIIRVLELIELHVTGTPRTTRNRYS